jgi:AmmeMemoRadiSam system protein B/AmmeMemoRadiSam system protein A
MKDPWHLPQDREAEFAGRFYPGNKEKLQNELSQLFGAAEPPKYPILKPQALISPHAGYVFSGHVAASAFNQIPEKASYSRVFVLASSHRMYFEGASVYTRGNYLTPLGTIDVDINLASQLATSGKYFSDNSAPHESEHSLEVQLPFLQYKLGEGFLLVPIILGTNSASECKAIAEILKPYFVQENLFVISTDFSHYPEYDDAVKVDSSTINSILSNDPQILLKTLDENKRMRIPGLSTSLCGWTSVLTLMFLTEGGNYEYIKTDYKNSGDNRYYGEKERVVGYTAIAVYPKGDEVFIISEKEKADILELARRSLVDSYGLKKFDKTGLDLGGVANRQLGAFVSLYDREKLQGCIGQFKSDKPLSEVIRKMVVSASNDRRFEKPRAEVLDRLTIEISVLSPLKKIISIDEIELGRHGIYIRHGFMSGTFLPQVATKTGWTKEEFLGHCSRDKAGLGWEGWKDAEIYTYEAVVFSDKPKV